MEFTRIRKAIIKDYKSLKAQARARILRDEFWLAHNLTDYRRNQLEGGAITKKKAQEIAIKRAFDAYDKAERRDLERLAEYEAAGLPEVIAIRGEYNRLGMDVAEAWTDGGDYETAAAYGYGYDKMGHACEAALAKCDQISALLCSIEEERLAHRVKKSRAEAFGSNALDSNFHIIPRFIGGDLWSVKKVLEKAGYFVHVTGTASVKCLDAMRRAKK